MAGDSKTEKASPKKRKDERKKGNVFQSKDIVSVASILVIFLFLKAYFPFMFKEISRILDKYFGYMQDKTTMTVTLTSEIGKDVVLSTMLIAMPTALLSIFIGVIATGAQTRFLFSAENLKPKFERMNPIKGIGKMFSLKSVVEIVKGIIKIAVIAFMIYDFINQKIIGYSKAFDRDIVQSIIYALDAVIGLVLNISIVFVFVAALDFMYQWWDYERQIKMSKHDVKEEYKQMEGDPKVKGKIKDKQRQMAMSRMMQAVPSADVVIKNPTHFAVALKYDMERDNAPILVAKGQDELALRIIAVATENNVYVVENKPLARTIFGSTMLNREIPIEHFGAVAEVLAFVYKLKNKDIQ